MTSAGLSVMANGSDAVWAAPRPPAPAPPTSLVGFRAARRLRGRSVSRLLERPRSEVHLRATGHRPAARAAQRGRAGAISTGSISGFGAARQPRHADFTAALGAAKGGITLQGGGIHQTMATASRRSGRRASWPPVEFAHRMSPRVRRNMRKPLDLESKAAELSKVSARYFNAIRQVRAAPAPRASPS